MDDNDTVYGDILLGDAVIAHNVDIWLSTSSGQTIATVTESNLAFFENHYQLLLPDGRSAKLTLVSQKIGSASGPATFVLVWDKVG